MEVERPASPPPPSITGDDGERPAQRPRTAAHFIAEEPETDTEGLGGRVLARSVDLGALAGDAKMNRRLRTNEAIRNEIPELEETPRTYLEMDTFLTKVERVAKYYEREADLVEIALSRMDASSRATYELLLRARFPGERHSYAQLARVIGDQMGAREPGEYLRQELGSIKQGELDPYQLLCRFCKVFATYERLCKRLGVAAKEDLDGAGTKGLYVALLKPRDATLVAAESQKPGKLSDLAALAHAAASAMALNEGRTPGGTALARKTPPEGRWNAIHCVEEGKADSRQSVMRVSASPSLTDERPSASGPSADVDPAGWPTVLRVEAAPPGRGLPPSPSGNGGGARLLPAGWTCFSCGSTAHSVRECPKHAAECARDPARAERCSGCNSPGLCTETCPRRNYFLSRPQEWQEVVRDGKSRFMRTDRARAPPRGGRAPPPSPAGWTPNPAPSWTSGPGPHPGGWNPSAMTPPGSWPPGAPAPNWGAPLAWSAPPGGWPAGPVPSGPWGVQPQPGPWPAPAILPPPKSPSGAAPPAVRTVEQRAGTGSRKGSGEAVNPAEVHTLLTRAARKETREARKPLGGGPGSDPRYKHTRAMVRVEGEPALAIIDTGADTSLIAVGHVPKGKLWRPWRPEDGAVVDGNERGFRCLGKIALEVHVGPVKEMASFTVVKGVNFEVLLGVDFLYANEIDVSTSRHALVFEGHGGLLVPLVGLSPRVSRGCLVSNEVILEPRESRMVAVRVVQTKDGTAQGVCLPESRQGPLMVPAQVVDHVAEVVNFGDAPLMLPEGMPLGRMELGELRKPPTLLRVAPPPAPATLVVAHIRSAESASTTDSPDSGAERDSSDAASEPTVDPATEVLPDGTVIPRVPGEKSCLTPEEAVVLRELVIEFKDRFNDGSRPIAVTNLFKATLDTGDVAPIRCPPRRLPPEQRAVVRELVRKLDEAGITEPGEGNWSAPIVLVKKANGQWRLCVDYRAVNKYVRTPQQPIPRPDDILGSFFGKKYFSVMDMCSGFHQIEVDEKDRPKTGFVTPDCQRQYRRLPFGFASSPAIFQRMVDAVLGGMKWISAVGYIDDIIVYSDTWPDHLQHLRRLFASMRKANVELHPGKCVFGAHEVKYLGHIISREGIRCSPEKTRAIMELPVPGTIKALQRFLGKCQYYRRFIPAFSTVALPLFAAQSGKRKELVWTEECQKAFDQLRGALTKGPILCHPDYTRSFVIDCDGSAEGLGAILAQEYEDGEHVVSYASRSLMAHEKKWSATELEAAAVVWALDTFRPYIYGVPVLVRTDHSALSFLQSRTEKCPRLQRWALRLQEFNFKLVHRPGRQQRHVDCLSRAPVPPGPNDAPILMDVFPDRAVLTVRRQDDIDGDPQLLASLAPGGCCWDCRALQSAREARQLRAWDSNRTLLTIHGVTQHRDELHAAACTEADEEDGDVEVVISEDEGEPDSEQLEGVPLPMEEDDGTIQLDSAKGEGESPLQSGRAVPLPPQPADTTLVAAQRIDPLCKKLADQVRRAKGRATIEEGQIKYEVFKEQRLLYVQFPDRSPRLVLPAALRDRAIHDHHLSYYAGHFGLHKTLARLGTRYWWPGMKNDVRDFLKGCSFCLAYTRDGGRARWLALPIGTPFEVVAMDIFGPLPRTSSGSRHILVLIDHHTRWVELVALAEPTATAVAEALFTRWISRWGVMRALLSDNGPQFVSDILRQLCAVYGIKKIYSSPYNPKGNSIVESYMRTLKATLILCTTRFRAEWDTVLPAAAFAYRATPHSTTRYSPYFLVTGQTPTLPLDREWEQPVLYPAGATWLRALWECRQKVLDGHKKMLVERAKAFLEATHPLEIGMVVAVRLTPKERASQGKFAPLYSGPFVIIEVLAHGASARVIDQRNGAERVVSRSLLKIIELPATSTHLAKLPRWLAPDRRQAGQHA